MFYTRNSTVDAHHFSGSKNNIIIIAVIDMDSGFFQKILQKFPVRCRRMGKIPLQNTIDTFNPGCSSATLTVICNNLCIRIIQICWWELGMVLRSSWE